MGADLLPEGSAWGAGSGVTSVTAAPRIASDAAASQPTKPEPITVTRTPGRIAAATAAESSHVRITWTPGRSAPSRGGRTGSEPVHSTHSAYASVSPSSRSTSRAPGRSAATGVAGRNSTSCRRNQASSSIGSSSAGMRPRRNSLVSGGRRYGGCRSAARIVTGARPPAAR